MSIHSGNNSLGSRSKTVEVTTTLYDLIEAIDLTFSHTSGSRPARPVQGQTIPVQDRLIARKISSMFLNGRIRFKHPRDVRDSFPELFD